MDVVITGIGLQSCLGSLTDSWNGILEGKSGIKIQQPFSELPAYPLAIIDRVPSQLSPLTESILKAAIIDADLNFPLSQCGVAIGSSRGCQSLWEKIIEEQGFDRSRSGVYNNKFKVSTFNSRSLTSSGNYWLDTLPHNSAVTTASLIQTTAPVLSPMAACATGIHAIARGYELIQTGECQRVIAGAVETPVTPLSLAGFARMGALAKTGCYPFDFHREGLVLGEGGALFVLETAELAHQRNAKIYGEILGFGLTCDASNLTAPEDNSRSAAIAIKNCLARSNLSPSDIDYIHAHGTSTKLNDVHEARLIQHLFNHPVAISSTKGATGHTLGASGAMGFAWCLMALQSGTLPPCVGLTNLEFELNVVKTKQQQKIDRTLCFSFGFGGQNAVLAIAKDRHCS